MKRKRKILDIILRLISFIMLVLACLNTYLILKYDVLPIKYLLIFLLLVVIIPLIFTFISIKIGKRKIKLKIFILLLDFLYVIVLGLAFYYLSATFSFFEGIGKGYEVSNYYVVTLNDSSYDKIEDINNKILGYVNDDENYEKPFEMLNRKVKVESKQYIAITELFEGLNNKEVDAIILLDTEYDMYFEDTEIENNTKKIYEFSIKEKRADITKEVDVDKEPFTVYISGMDSYKKISAKSRSDVNILVSVNPKTNQILLINTPRDYYVTLPSKGVKDKLTHAGMLGVEESVKALENLLDVEINYYVKVNYNALIKLIDAIGGVDVNSEYDFYTVGTDHYFHFKKGFNHVDGIHALEFARTRYAFKDGDRVRGENQQRVIQAIVNKMTSSDVLLTKYNSILNNLNGTFVTNVSSNMITELVRIQLDKKPAWNMTSISLNGSDGSEYSSIFPTKNPLYVMYPNEETVNNAKKMLDDLQNGKKILLENN